MQIGKIDVDNTYLLVRFSYEDSNGVCYDGYEENLFLARSKTTRIENPNLEIKSVSKTSTGFDVLISCERPAFFIVLDSGDIKGRFDDNLFSLNGSRTIKFKSSVPSISEKDFASKLKVYDLYSSSKEE